MMRPGYGCFRAAVLLSLLLLAACATTPQTRQITRHPPDIPPHVELEQTPFYPQRDYQCGPAALATVINFYQTLTTPDELESQVYIPSLKGSLQIEMIAAARRLGFLAILQDGQLGSILREVAAGHPVLVFQNLGFDAYPFWHYAVVIGYDLEQQELILRSGERKRLLRPFDVFERTWQRAGHWAVVVVPPQVMPVSVREKEFTEAAVAIDSLSAYQSGLERWPGSFELQFALGNKAYASGDYSLSATAFQTATKLAPRRAEAWNNLAYALWKLDQRKPAITAVQKALQLDPDNPNFADSLKEIGSQSQ